MSPAARELSRRNRTKPRLPKGGEPANRRPRGSPELRKAAEQAASRAEALEALFRPLQEAGQAELKKTKSGRKLLQESRAFAKKLGELHERIISGKISFSEGQRLVRERHEVFRARHMEGLTEAHAQYARLQPSVEAVVQVLRPDMARTTWISETSFLRAMLMRPKAPPDNVRTVLQGLGDPPLPPALRSCSVAPYSRKEEYQLAPPLSVEWRSAAAASPEKGLVTIAGNCVSTVFFHIQAHLASAFVGQDFPVPSGPTSYTLTITYDWHCWGFGAAALGVAIVNVDLAIAIDKRDGTPRETHAREVTLLTVPVIGGDSFSHSASNAKVTIPFTRDGSNGTVRIMVGADGHCMTAAVAGAANFGADVNVREICVEATG